MTAIRTQARDQRGRHPRGHPWPRRPADDWSKGFLAGIFDAEGGAQRGVIRIANTDPAIIDWTT